MNGETVFIGLARACCSGGCGWPKLPFGGVDFRCERCERSEVKWSQRLRATGSAAASPAGRKQPRSLAVERDWLVSRLRSVPDLTLRALVAELRERGVMTSYGSVRRIVHDEGISFKKTLFATEQDRPDVARRRARWKAHQNRLDPARLVFIDETCFVPHSFSEGGGQDQYDAPARVGAAWPQAGGESAARQMANSDLPRSTAP